MSTVLVADGDLVSARYLAELLEEEGFATRLTSDGLDALELARGGGVDFVLVADDLPGAGGLDLCRRLRADAGCAGLPVVVLTAEPGSGRRVLALESGADDCLDKPFDSLELVARVRATLRRSADMRAVSPLTGLPGNARIDEQLADRHHSGAPYAIGHVDLDNFKAFNDAYGFLRGDQVIRLLARCLREAAGAVAGSPVFTGHVGGDDFVVICEPEQAEAVCRAAVVGFEAAAPALHDPADVASGGFRVRDRRGELRFFPLVSVSVGIAVSRPGVTDPRELVTAAGEMKGVAKRHHGSYVALDRRGG